MVLDLTDRGAAFCTRLKSTREANGISLEQISTSTKIPIALLRGLERGDLSRWPDGLFRRSYLRDYLRAVGLPSDPLIAEFQRLCSEAETPAPDATVTAASEQPRSVFPMTIADGAPGAAATMRRRVGAAVLDALIVLMASGGLVLVLGVDPHLSVAWTALTYYSVSTVLVGRSICARWVDDLQSRQWKRRTLAACPPPASAETSYDWQLT
jgi:hypothetical protein